jgi:hypothetical protein
MRSSHGIKTSSGNVTFETSNESCVGLRTCVLTRCNLTPSPPQTLSPNPQALCAACCTSILHLSCISVCVIVNSKYQVPIVTDEVLDVCFPRYPCAIDGASPHVLPPATKGHCQIPTTSNASHTEAEGCEVASAHEAQRLQLDTTNCCGGVH